MQNKNPLGELTKNLYVWQKFAAPYEVLSGVVLFMATHVRPILSTLNIRINQAEGEQALITFQIVS